MKQTSHIVVSCLCIAGLLQIYLQTSFTNWCMYENKSVPQAELKREKDDILMMVMGEKQMFPIWLNRLKALKIGADLTFVYGSYDEEIIKNDTDVTDFSDSFTYSTIFIPKTTWTQGRTLLGEKAIELEYNRAKKFDFWGFSDDDFDLVCNFPTVFDTSEDCWEQVFYNLRTDLPSKITMIAPQLSPKQNLEFGRAVTSVDAIFNVFRREYVPYYQPYVALPPGESEWLSQLVLFLVVQTCFPSSVYVIPRMFGKNPLHRKYARGLPLDVMKTIAQKNYGNVTDAAISRFESGKSFYDHMHGSTPHARDIEEVNDSIPSHNLMQCRPMKERYEKWEQEVINRINN